MMRIGLNLLHARREIGGGWNYIANIVSMLKLLDCDYEFIAYCTSASAEIVPDDPRFIVKIVHLGGSSQIARVTYEQCILPFMAYRDKVDCMHWFANNRSILGLVPSVVTIHDFIYIERPSEVSFAKRLYLQQMARFACKWADSLAPVSETTAETAVRLFGVERKRIFVVRNQIDDTFYHVSTEEVKEFRERFKLPPNFWLYVAHPYPHKNHARLFDAYKKCRDAIQCTWPLVLRGDRANRNEMLDHKALDLGIAESVIWLPRLPTEDMTRLYSAATAMVFPSLYEGCGIPVLEAMACGCPVIASDISTTREFAGDATLMFDATNVDSIYGAMMHFISNPLLRESCAAKGLMVAEAYSPRKIVGKLLMAYRNAVTRQAVNR
jgi:glycosyltransferase involved in cell wall biosynthesis